MGIRYDRDRRQATNGPMIFFSDPSSKELLGEEIRGAVVSQLSFYCYRLPEDTMISFGSSEGVVEGIGVPGFAIGMFDPSLPYITIPYKGGKRDQAVKCRYEMPRESVSYEEYAREVSGIISDLQGLEEGKVVAARVVLEKENVDLGEIFFEFTERFPEAMVFCFATPATGCWIGASPELLLEGKEGELNTMALAGTRPAATGGQWDDKNIEEQAIVARYICRVFEDAGLQPVLGETYNKVTGKIEHICTPIYALRGGESDGGGEREEGENEIEREERRPEIDLEGLLRELSPTPALCGNPKVFALEELRKYERFDRGCYGGFCGPYHSASDFRFNVVLRCASVNEEGVMCRYAGGGITAKSSVAAEWEETRMKLFPLFPDQRN